MVAPTATHSPHGGLFPHGVAERTMPFTLRPDALEGGRYYLRSIVDGVPGGTSVSAEVQVSVRVTSGDHITGSPFTFSAV